MRNGLREIADRELSALRWEARNRNAVLARTKGAVKMKKRMSVGLIVALILALGAVSALAAYALTRSPEAQAMHEARQALRDAYGLSAETLGIFVAEYEETQQGWRVTMRAGDGVDGERAGVYTVEKTQDGLAAAWSHDGLDPALWRGGDLTAPAYGQEQLYRALHEGREEAERLAREEWSLSEAQAQAIGTAADYDEAGARLVEDNAGRRMWEFALEVDLEGAHVSGGVFVDAQTGEIVRFDYTSLGNG